MKPLSHMALESTSLNASVSPQYNAGPKGFNTNYSSYRGGTGRGAGSSNTNTFRGNSSTGNRSNLFCEYCKRTGHTKDRCYKLHGYPANTRTPRGRGTRSAANVHTSEDDGSQCEENSEQGRQVPLNLSKGQYEQLLNLLGTLQVGNGVDCSGNMSSGAANLAVKVTEIGDVCLNSTLTLYKVLFIPSFKFNLISVHCLAVQLKGIVILNNFSCLLQGPSLKSPLALGKARNGLYFFCPKCHSYLPTNGNVVPPERCQPVSFFNYCKKISVGSECKASSPNVRYSHEINKKACSIDPASCSAVNSFLDINPTHSDDTEFLWRARLGHVPFVKMRIISTIPLKISNKQPFICTICPMARQTKMPFPESITATNSIFELLHIDLWGPYYVPTHDGYHYFLTMVDDYSRSTWTQLLRCKSNALHTIKAFTTLIENQFHTKLKTIRSDNGLEFSSTEAICFFQEKGIIHQKSCPYTPQQNGVVERKHKYLREIARALLFQSKMPMRYWGECVLTATYLINRLPTKLLQNKSPYELLYHKKPTYSHLRSFGCLCFPTTLKTHKDKFEPRTTPHIFIGYPFNTKGYKVLNLATKRIHVSRDVLFHETIFPFVIAPVGSSFNSVLQFLVHHSDKLSYVSSKTNNFVDDEMLNSHTLVEVTSDHVPIPENTPVTEPTALIPPAEPNVSALGDAHFAPRRTTSLNVTKVTGLKKKQPTRRSHSRPKSFFGKGQKEEQDSIASITNNPT
uniref:Retroelement pol polyprotein n=1 Tax=Solanum tuberosum TaxID=4113 RepID=M1D8Y3_SOLTU